MRIVGGSAKGRKLKAVPGSSTRPILDRVKTSLFDILRPELPGMHVLDLFAGTGAVGIEALSQGAAHCVFLDLERRAAETIRENVSAAGLSEVAEVRQTDAFAYLRHTTKSFDLIYVAPPQYQTLWVQALHALAERSHILKAGGLVIAQIDPKEYESLELREFRETEQRKYGNTLLVFWRKSKG